MLVVGFHAVSELLEKTGFAPGDKLIVARQGNDGRMQKILTRAQRSGAQVLRKNYSELNQIAGSKNHQGILLERESPLELREFTKQDFVAATSGIYLALDGVQDPQNLGAIVRSAAGLGVSGIFLPQKDSAPAGATAFKVSAGALAEMPMCFTGSIASLMQFVSDKRPEIPMVVLDGAGEPFRDADGSLVTGEAPLLLIAGSEQGVSRLVLERATHVRRLRMAPAIESYNVSVAVALALYELTRHAGTRSPG